MSGLLFLRNFSDLAKALFVFPASAFGVKFAYVAVTSSDDENVISLFFSNRMWALDSLFFIIAGILVLLAAIATACSACGRRALDRNRDALIEKAKKKSRGRGKLNV